MATVLAISNPIYVGDHSDCDTAILKYRDESNAWGYDYAEKPEFYQQVRIGINIREPRYAKNETVYRKTNGVKSRANTYIDKTREMFTDPMDEPTVDALTTALTHSHVDINNEMYFSEGDFEIEPSETTYMMNVKATLFVQGYNKTNISCL